MKNWRGGSVSKALSGEKDPRVILDPKAEGGERPMTMLELLKAGLARRMDLYVMPLISFNGQYKDRRGTAYRWSTTGVRRVFPIKVKGKAAVKQAKRDRRARREREAYLQSRMATS